MLAKTLLILFTAIFFSGCATPRNGLYISTKKIDEKELLKAGFEKTHEQVSYSKGGVYGYLTSITPSMLDEYNGDLLTNVTVDANYRWFSFMPQYRLAITADVWRKKSPCDKNAE